MLPALLIPILLKFGEKIIDQVIPDKEAKEKALYELTKLANDKEAQELDQQYKAIVAEANSQDKWTSRARPSFLYVVYIMILFSLPMGLAAVFAPQHVMTFIGGVNLWLNSIPGELYTLFGAGYLGYGAYRTIDKVKGK